MAGENRPLSEVLGTAKELALIEAQVETSLENNHHADNPPDTGENINSSGANEKDISTLAKALPGDQYSESIPIKEDTHSGAVIEYESTQFWNHPFRVRTHPNSPAVGATTPTHMDECPVTAKYDPGNIPGLNNMRVGAQYHASIPPIAVQYPAATYSIPQHFNSGEVAGAPQFPISRHSISGQFILGQAAGAASSQFLTSTCSASGQFILSQAAGAATGTSGGPVRRATCSSCHEFGHRVDACPYLPCKYCANMGHVGRDCLTVFRYRKRLGKCSFCKEPGHRRDMCPSRPCKYCGAMGHVGTACPSMAEERTERKRKVGAWRQDQYVAR